MRDQDDGGNAPLMHVFPLILCTDVTAVEPGALKTGKGDVAHACPLAPSTDVIVNYKKNKIKCRSKWLISFSEIKYTHHKI